MRMRFAVIGGDARAGLLCSLLLEDGHRVRTFALERAELPAEASRDSCLTACVYGADAVILPVPAEKGGFLNAPLSEEKLTLEELLGCLWPGQLVFGGGLDEELCRAAAQGKLRPVDLLRRPDYVYANAALTAEGAVSLLMAESDRALRDSKALVLGFGRIGKPLALSLQSLGTRVTVVARAANDRALARALGLDALAWADLAEKIGDYDFVVNTVPAPVLREAELCCLRQDALLLELASLPGGFDRLLAENIGLHALYAPGLPARYAPRTAAALLRDAVCRAISEQEE